MRTLMNIVETAQTEPWIVHRNMEWQQDHPDYQYDGWTPDHGIDYFVRTEFTTGGCGQLAAAIHDRTGWPIYVDEDGDEWGHAYCINPNGHAVDINGVHPSDWAQTKYSINKGNIRKVNRKEISNDGPDGYYGWATALLDNFPDHFGIIIQPTNSGDNHPVDEGVQHIRNI